MEKQPPDWIERVKATYKFHVSKIREAETKGKKWTIRETAKCLNRAIGPVSEELKVAGWLRTHSSQLEEFEFFHEAIEYIRQRKHRMLMEDLPE